MDPVFAPTAPEEVMGRHRGDEYEGAWTTGACRPIPVVDPMHPDVTRATLRSRIFTASGRRLHRGAADRWPTFEPKTLRGYLGPLARPFRTYQRKHMPAWRRERTNSCHGLPYRHGPWPMVGMRQRQARCGRGWPFWDSSPLSNLFLLLLRSRGALGRVRATPGAASAAAARMDGPDGRMDGIPGGGKGLTPKPSVAAPRCSRSLFVA